MRDFKSRFLRGYLTNQYLKLGPLMKPTHNPEDQYKENPLQNALNKQNIKNIKSEARDLNISITKLSLNIKLQILTIAQGIIWREVVYNIS